MILPFAYFVNELFPERLIVILLPALTVIVVSSLTSSIVTMSDDERRPDNETVTVPSALVVNVAVPFGEAFTDATL